MKPKAKYGLSTTQGTRQWFAVKPGPLYSQRQWVAVKTKSKHIQATICPEARGDGLT